ncbi:Hsp20/alpha crystallin family protein [Dyadobacter sp. NIV53]|uniref:Hsp20/alpha crystallin family protein n=1 Tax=Dyadobacter sp. NIV53 TaxID=2861765 RepID=UPI001C889335|nr:Hsp20/alpha crystallin family protein [Dyadobacter sp. NIV53]
MCYRYENRGYGMNHGNRFGDRGSFRVPVNIAKNENSYELLVFAPDRGKDDFRINIKGNELTIGYELKNEESENKSWIRHEFRKTSFERTFQIDETVDAENIKAEYTNGILHLTLPIVPGSEKPAQEIKVI